MQHSRRKFLGIAATVAVMPHDIVRAQTLPLLRFVAAAPVIRPDLAFQFLGMPMGYYERLGYRGDFMTIAGSAAALQLIVSGTADIANIGFLEFISAKQKQPNLPLTFVFIHEKMSVYQVVVLPDSPIKSMSDFKGKAIGVPNLASGTIPMTRGMLKQAGVDPATVQFLPIGAGPQALAAVKNKQVDAVSTHIGQIAAMEILGQEFRYFKASIPASGFVMHNDYIAKNPDLVTKALQGIVLNQVLMLENPASVIRAFWKMNGQPTGDAAKALKDGVHYVSRTAGTFKPLNDPEPWGLYTDEDWNKLKRFVDSEGLIRDDAELSKFYTGKFVKSANEANIELAREAAKAFSG